MSNRINRLFTAISVALLANLCAFGQVTVRQVAADTSDEKAQLNDAGQVLYETAQSIEPYMWSYSLWMWSNGTSQLVAAQGGQAPGFSTGTNLSSGPYSYLLNDSGQIAFSGDVYPKTDQGVDEGTWVGTPGNLQLVSTTDNYFGLDSAGNVMVQDQNGYSLVGPAETVHVIGKDDPAPGTNGLSFTSVGAASVTPSDYVAFDGQTTTPVFSNGNWSNYSGGLWEYAPGGSVREILQSGQQATGLPPGTDFGAPPNQDSSPFIDAMSNRGNIIFTDGLYGVGMNDWNYTALFAYVNGSVHLLVRSDDPVPQFSPFIFGDRYSDEQIDDRGDVAFIAAISGQFGMFRWEQGQLDLLMWHGEYAPGFNDQFLLSSVNQMFMDDQGQIFFTSTLVPDTGISAAPFDTLWMIGTDGQLHLLLKTSVPVDVDGQSVTFNAFGLIGINNNEQALIDDPSYRGEPGLFLLNVPSGTTTAPEPAGACIALAGLGLVAIRGRHFVHATTLPQNPN